jgi:hypothetical protein
MSEEFSTHDPAEGGEDVFAVIKRGMGRPSFSSRAVDTTPVAVAIARGETVTLTDDEMGIQAVAAVHSGATVNSVTNSINAMQQRLEWL